MAPFLLGVGIFCVYKTLQAAYKENWPKATFLLCVTVVIFSMLNAR